MVNFKNMHMPVEQNMGTMDRIMRSAIGGAMLMNALNSRDGGFVSKLGGIIGGAFVVYGMTGWDPLLTAFHTSTQPGDTNNLMHKTRMIVKSKKNGKTMDQPVSDDVAAMGV